MKGRGGRGPVKGAPERLAVQGHHALTALGEAAHEGHKTRLELGRIEQPKHAREGVMAWDAVPEREDLAATSLRRLLTSEPSASPRASTAALALIRPRAFATLVRPCQTGSAIAVISLSVAA